MRRLPEATPALRAQLDERARVSGWPALHAELSALDPARPHVSRPPTGSVSSGRWKCVCSTGRPISELQRATVSPLAGWPVLQWVLAPGERAQLHERLAQRFAAMMAAGFLEEVRRLHGRADLTARHPAMRSVGYRQLWAHLDGDYGLEEAAKRGVAATRQLAKRQLTWMRGEPGGRWVDPLATEPLSWIRDTCAQLAGFGL